MSKIDTPHRVQRKRTKGWRMPENTASVCRPGKWGNPFKVGETVTYKKQPIYVKNAAMAVELFRDWIYRECPQSWEHRSSVKASLRGKNLACFCPLEQPCHADVLLEIANR